MIRILMIVFAVWLSNSGLLSARDLSTENVVLVTLDGVRWQEFFRGADEKLLDAGEHDALRAKVWRETPEARREALMPFFWKRLAPQGVVLGNRDLRSEVQVRNPHRFSYPGYAELLLGEVRPEVDSNDTVYSPRETVLEFLQRKLRLSRFQVAAFASWEVFNFICMTAEDRFYVNAGYEASDSLGSQRAQYFNRLQFQTLTPWDTVRHDAYTGGLALEYVEMHQPRIFYVALGETDDWAHDGRYDRVLHGLMLADQFLSGLWERLSQFSQYRGRTTLILTTDHGRGRGLEDWTDHGADVAGAEEAWLAVLGPDTPNLGEISGSEPLYLDQVAATILSFLEINWKEYSSETGPPISQAMKTE